jgi:hypothetical protein
MSSADRLIDAVRRAEKAMQALSAALADYDAAFAAIERASPDEARQCDAAVGPRRLHVLLVQRLRALGLGPVLAQAATASRVDYTWVRDVTATISALVRR